MTTTAKKKPSRAVAVHEPAPPPAPVNLLQVIAAAAANPRCNVEKMKALLDMQRDIEDRDARKAFTVAFNALQSELPVIDRDGKIDHGDGVTARGNKKLKTRYATYPNLMTVCNPLMKRHGFTLSSTVRSNPAGLMVVTSHLEHVMGHFRETEFTLSADTSGGKNNQQGWGSSQQYGMRYNAIALLNITTKAPQDADNDGFPVSANITAAQTDELIAIIEDAGADKQRFCEVFEIEGIADLPARRFDEAKARVEAYKKSRKQARDSDFPGDRR